MISKQLLLGIGLVVGGGLLAIGINGGDKDAKAKQSADSDVAHPKVEPLKHDIQTERHLSEQKKKERESNALAQEQQVKAFVEEQERAKQQPSQPAENSTNPNIIASNTASNGNNGNNSINTSINTVVSEVSAMLPNNQPMMSDELTVQVRPETIVATKKAEEKKRKQQAYANQQKINATKSGQHIIARGDSLSKLSQQYNVPISAIVSANNLIDADTLIAGDILIIPGKSTKQVQAKAKTANGTTAEKDKKAKSAESASGKARTVKPFYSVQVSLADSDAKANELVRQYRAAGYKVQTSRTNRGVRVLVGSASNAEEANKLKAKLHKDSRVNASDAWVKRVDTLNP